MREAVVVSTARTPIGPVFAVPRLMARTGLAVADIDLWELKEAFAVQTLYCRDRFGIDPARLGGGMGAAGLFEL